MIDLIKRFFALFHKTTATSTIKDLKDNYVAELTRNRIEAIHNRELQARNQKMQEFYQEGLDRLSRD